MKDFSRPISGSCGTPCKLLSLLVAVDIYLTSSRFAFQPWHSAVEFKRYLHRFIHEFPRINSLAGVDRTPLNQYDSIILPLETYLKAQGVNFHYGRPT
jgi:myosin-crossreactive antigen